MRFSTLYHRITAVSAACVLAIPAAACGSAGSPGGSTEKKILLEITGPPEADITFQIGADQTQKLGEKVPFKHETTSSQDPLIVVLSAQSKSAGEIVCKISIDGKEAKTNKSTGEFANVTCANDPTAS